MTGVYGDQLEISVRAARTQDALGSFRIGFGQMPDRQELPGENDGDPATALTAILRGYGCRVETGPEMIKLVGPPSDSGWLSFVLSAVVPCAEPGSWWHAGDGFFAVVDPAGTEGAPGAGEFRYEDVDGNLVLGVGGIVRHTQELLEADPGLAPRESWQDIVGRVAGEYATPGHQRLPAKPGAALDADIIAMIPDILREAEPYHVARGSGLLPE